MEKQRQRPKISIIVPVYNVQKYIRRCIDSILSQNYHNLEILLIDDGSSDDSGMICDEYAQLDTRIKVFHKENNGVSSARNLGIENASGEWIYFCDSDDEILQDGISILVSRINTNIDLVMAGYEINGQTKVAYSSDRIISAKEAKFLLLKSPNGCYQGYLWSKIFKRSVIIENAIRFNVDIKFNEDRLFIYHYISKSKCKILVLSSAVYRYYDNECGAMNSIHKGNHLEFISDLKAFKEIATIERNETDSELLNTIYIALFDSYYANKALIKKYSVNPTADLCILNSEIKDISYCKKVKIWSYIKLRAIKKKLTTFSI